MISLLCFTSIGLSICLLFCESCVWIARRVVFVSVFLNGFLHCSLLFWTMRSGQSRAWGPGCNVFIVKLQNLFIFNPLKMPLFLKKKVNFIILIFYKKKHSLDQMAFKAVIWSCSILCGFFFFLFYSQWSCYNVPHLWGMLPHFSSVPLG